MVQSPQRVRSREAVDLFSIDHGSVVACGGAKTISFLIIRGIHVGAAIGDQMNSIEHRLKREQVVMPVAAAPGQTHRTAINEHMVPFAAHHVKAAIWKSD